MTDQTDNNVDPEEASQMLNSIYGGADGQTQRHNLPFLSKVLPFSLPSPDRNPVANALGAVQQAIPENRTLPAASFPFDPRSMSFLNMLRGIVGSQKHWAEGAPHAPDMLLPPGVLAPSVASTVERSAIPQTIRGYHGTAGELEGGKFLEGGPSGIGNYEELNVPHQGVWFSDDPTRAGLFAKQASYIKGMSSRRREDWTGANTIPADLAFQRTYRIPPEQIANEGHYAINAYHPSFEDLRKMGYDSVAVPRASWGRYEEGKPLGLDVSGYDYAALKPDTARSPLTGNVLYADGKRSAIPGIILDSLEDRIPQGSDIDRLRRANLNEGRKGMAELYPPHHEEEFSSPSVIDSLLTESRPGIDYDRADLYLRALQNMEHMEPPIRSWNRGWNEKTETPQAPQAAGERPYEIHDQHRQGADDPGYTVNPRKLNASGGRISALLRKNYGA